MRIFTVVPIIQIMEDHHNKFVVFTIHNEIVYPCIPNQVLM